MNARDLMTTNVIRIGSNVTIGQAVHLLKEHTISGLPVVNENGQLIGVITGGMCSVHFNIVPNEFIIP